MKVVGVKQICFVVKDLEQTISRYTETFGFGPWVRFSFTPEDMEKSPHETYGELRPIHFIAAKTQVGNLEFEFMQPVSDNSVYADFLKEHGEGFHHFYLWTDDFDESCQELEKDGHPPIQKGVSAFGNLVVYYDLFEEFGYAIELGRRAKKEDYGSSPEG